MVSPSRFFKEKKFLIICLFMLNFLFFLVVPLSMKDLSSPGQGLNPCHLQWKPTVLTAGPPGSPESFLP